MNKKLLITLGALTLASTAIMAAEGDGLKIKSVGQGVAYEDRRTEKDTASAANANLNFYNNVSLGYESWTFNLESQSNWMIYRKDQIVEIKDSTGKVVGTTTKKAERGDGYVAISAIRGFGGESAFQYSLGPYWEHSPAYDQFQFQTSYSYTIFSGWVNPKYTRSDAGEAVQNNQGFYVLAPRNSVALEAEPIKVTALKTSMGDLAVSYYADMAAANGTQSGSINQQVRVYFPIYKNDSWSINGEYRGTLSVDTINHNGTEVYGVGKNADPFGVNRIKGNFTYTFANGVAVKLYALYENGSWKTAAKDTKDAKNIKSSYYETGLSWNYNF